MKKSNVSASSGTFNGVLAGAAVNGTAIFLGQTYCKVRGLCALVTVDGETDTITLTAKWQVSRNGTTWVDVSNGTQNASGVALVTGTAGADAAVTKTIPLPNEAAQGYPYARIALVVGVATGTTNDTYAISYDYEMLTAGSVSA